MKNRVVIGLVVLMSFSAGLGAQVSLDGLKKLLELNPVDQRKPIMRKAMALTGDPAHAFWPIYDRYSDEYDAILREEFDVLDTYSKNFPNTDEEMARDLAERVFNVEEARLNLRRKYHDEVASALDYRHAGRFIQIDNQLDLILGLQWSAQVPLIQY